MSALGIVYVAYGAPARVVLRQAIGSLRQHCDLSVTVIGDIDPGIPKITFIPFAAEPTGRWAKLNLDSLSPYLFTLYLDADTVVMNNVDYGFKLLAQGYDLALAVSENQGSALLSHSSARDKEATRAALGNPDPLQLQAGVMWIARDRCRNLWAAWRAEWQAAGGGQDQGALLRALDKSPVRVFPLPQLWNSRNGAVVEHHFGSARLK